MRLSGHGDGDDAAPRPLPQWLLWLWWLALVVGWIATLILGALIWLVDAAWRILRWPTGHRRRGHTGDGT